MIDLAPKKLDLYIMKKFMLTFFIAILLIIGIVIIFDVSEKIEDFVNHEAPLKAIIFDYYVNFVPYFMNMFSPLFVFITVIFFTSKMASNSEIVAILSCGISFHRMMVPYMVSAAIIALMSLYLNTQVIPKANETRIKFENDYIAKEALNAGYNTHYQIAPGSYVFVESFSDWNRTAYKFTLEDIKNNKLVRKISAETAQWDTVKRCWTLTNYFVREYLDNVEDKVTRGATMDTVIALTLDDFRLHKSSVQKIQQKELNKLIATQKMRGDANVMYAQIEKHNRLSMPFSSFILTIMGVSLSSKKKRGGLGWNLVTGIGLSFTYILFMKFSQMFVFTGAMSPGLAIWFPNMVFTVLAAFLYKIAPK